MTDPEKSKPPESPTTARELDFDDEEDVPNASPKPKTLPTNQPAVSALDSANPVREDDVPPPPPPPRPASPREQAENTLKEAFPSIEATVVRAVLAASGGRVEPAFNALLGMSDPDAAQHEAAPPPPPPRPVAQSPAPQGNSQLERDEVYARQLAEHYQSQDAHARDQESQRRVNGQQAQQRSPNQMGYYDEERERNFIDDDLPVIRDNIRKGFLETQSKVNSFITNLRKKIDGEEEEDDPPPQPPRRPNQQAGRSSETVRRSGDRARYDADPEVFGDDFAALQLRDETASPRAGGRPLANPDLFKPTPATPDTQANPGRRVSFQEGPPETIDESLYRSSPSQPQAKTSAGNKSKWQPLESLEPDPVSENDPFSLGDSDDEESKKKDPKPEDVKNLQKATAEAMAEQIGSGDKEAANPKAGDA